MFVHPARIGGESCSSCWLLIYYNCAETRLRSLWMGARIKAPTPNGIPHKCAIHHGGQATTMPPND